MKKHILSILIFAMLLMLLAATAAADKDVIKAGTTVVVNNPDFTDRLNLRTRPSQTAPSLGKYYNGTYLNVLSDEKDGWAKVRIFTLEGYMMTKYLVYPEALQIDAATVPTVTVQNTGGTGLNLRKAQSTQSASLGLYPNGASVRVFGLSETWCHVQTDDGNVGFMLRERLSPVLEYQKSSAAGTTGGSNTTGGTGTTGGSTAVVSNPNSIDRLNLRTRPSQTAPTLGKYYSGTVVEVLSGDNNGFTKVRISNLEGYMMTSYLVFGQNQANVASAIPSVKIANAGGTGLNLRQRQSTSSASLGLYSNGSTVLVLGVSEGWCHVQTADGKVGFMLRESLSPTPEFERTGDGDMLKGA